MIPAAIAGVKRISPGRPPKNPEVRKTANMKIPLTDEEKELVQSAAEAESAKPVTWARNVLLRAAKRGMNKSGGRGS